MRYNKLIIIMMLMLTAVAINVSATDYSSLNESLVAYYNFDDNSTQLIDSLGNNNGNFTSGSFELVDGIINYGFDFQRSDT